MLCNVISDERGKPRVISCAARNVAAEIFLPFPFGSLGRAARYALARLRLVTSLKMTIIFLNKYWRKANLVRRLRANQFVAQASSTYVNCPDYIIEGPKKSGQEKLSFSNSRNF